MNKNLKKLISTVAALAITATSAFTAFAANFSDVADTADYKVAVDNLVALGIVNGYEDGTFGPEKEITRAEASKMIVGTMGPAMMDAAEASKGSSNFTDVAGDHWASGFIAQGVSKGYINGMGDGTFAPNANVTYAQVVKMLVCVLGYGEDAEANGGWPNGYINQGSALEITDGVNVANADTAVNRGQVAMLINNALDTPIKGIVGYEQGFKMVDGQLVPTPVPVTVVYDGKDRDYPDYETLLTTYFDAYAVRGRIEDTTTKGEGYVKFKVEYSQNFDDEVYGVKGNSESLEPDSFNEVYYPAGLDVDALLCAYADAIIMENEDGDWEIVSITPYGKNEVVTVSSELHVKDSLKMPTTDAKGNIEFYKSLASSKKDDYDLDPKAVVYVNGIEIKTDVEKTVTDCLADATAEFKFVNTPKNGSKSIDDMYDYIMITSYITAVVDEVFVEEDNAEIYLKDSTAGISSIKLDLDDLEDDKVEYIFEDKDGNEVSYEDLVAYDVLTIYASTVEPKELEKRDSGVSYIKAVVTKDVAEGKLSTADEDNKIITVGGEDYAFAGAFVNKIVDDIGDDFTIYLNAFGKIAYYEKTASVVNYGIINRVWTNNNGEEVVRIVNTDGQVVTYEFNKANDYDTWLTVYEDLSDEKNKYAAPEKFVDKYKDLIITYKVNSNDKIYSIESAATLKDGFDMTTGKEEYDAKNQKVGKAKMSDKTKVIDFSLAVDAWYGSIATKVSSGSVDSFVDGEEYQVIYGGTQFTDKTYPFVIVVGGVARVGTASRFAVVMNTPSSSINEADGIDYESVRVLEGKEEKTLYFDGDAPALKKGDVIVYGVNGEGLVEEKDIKVLYNAETSIALDDVAAVNAANGNSVYYTFANSKAPWTEDRYGDDDKQAKLGYGVLVDKSATDITVGTVVDKKTTTFEDIDVATDVNVYVYDLGIGKGDKVSAGSMASLTASKLPAQDMEDDVYKWSEKYTAVKTVYFKTYEDEITDIIVVIPED